MVGGMCQEGYCNIDTNTVNVREQACKGGAGFFADDTPGGRTACSVEGGKCTYIWQCV
ncbi:predicted protein [Plenodomus lingam JN3]|uniref:Predicted protein n=1 Tax=Leptosphaeria maculans (strain JN3 / isolate v23.1.3 / race Av1-4-5-6-7-8) TaxID=985895 RepID=E4ZIC7_LEPMJ|nr:predicted protein [Plenodomus lingam JN3]CBX90788.1 predicted protein [Plenodomus lingam JN3]